MWAHFHRRRVPPHRRKPLRGASFTENSSVFIHHLRDPREKAGCAAWDSSNPRKGPLATSDGRQWGFSCQSAHATGVNASPPWSCHRRQCGSRAAGAGVLRPRRRRQYRPASYPQAKGKCVITNRAGYRPATGVSHVLYEPAIPAIADFKATEFSFSGHKTTEQTQVLS